MLWNIIFVFTIFFYIIWCYFVWAAIHEFSHVYMAHILVGITYWEIDLLPKFIEGGKLKHEIRFASCVYYPTKKPTTKQYAAIHLAPRIPDILGAIVLPFTIHISKPFIWLAFIFCCSALVDLFVGSIGKSERSDLQRAATTLNISPWVIRLFGYFSIVISILFTIKNLGWLS